MLSHSEIAKNLGWLVKNASPPVKYLTHRYLLDVDLKSEEVRKLQNAVDKDAQVVEIFSKQRKDGSWCSGGAWALPPSYLPKGGYTPVSPKYVTTAWILPILGDMGYSVKDGRIKKACEYILLFQCNNGYIAESDIERYDVAIDQLHNMPCRFAVILVGLGKVGANADARVNQAYNLLAQWQREDGGWILQKHKEERKWDRSCPYATYHATYALYLSQKKKYERCIHKGLEFLVKHLGKKRKDEIQRFFYHGHHTINELLMLSEYNIGISTRPIKTLLGWLLEMYNHKDGCFNYNGKPVSKYSRRADGMDARVAKYRLFHLIEKDWLTYYMTRIAKNIVNM